MADKIVKLVDKNSNNLYPVAGAVIDNAVSTGAISNQAVTTAKIADANVTTVKLANDAVTEAKIANNAVTTNKLTNGSVTNAKLNTVAKRGFVQTYPHTSTAIAANSDLNTVGFVKVGTYHCTTAIANTLANKPTGTAGFKMTVYNVVNSTIDNETTSTWVLRTREIIDLYGQVWRQQVGSNATAGNFTYGPWERVIQTESGLIETDNLANGAVTGVANNATSIGTAKLALNTVGTPNLRNQSVTSDKIDWPTLGTQVATLSSQIDFGTNRTEFVSVTVGPGTWLLMGILDVCNNPSTGPTDTGESWVTFYNKTSSSEIPMRHYIYLDDAAGSPVWITWPTYSVVTLTSASQIALVGAKERGTLYGRRFQIIAVRVG